jgi:hypothetical protein
MVVVLESGGNESSSPRLGRVGCFLMSDSPSRAALASSRALISFSFLSALLTLMRTTLSILLLILFRQ